MERRQSRQRLRPHRADFALLSLLFRQGGGIRPLRLAHRPREAVRAIDCAVHLDAQPDLRAQA